MRFLPIAAAALLCAAIPGANAQSKKIFGSFFDEVTKIPSVYKCVFIRMRYDKPSAMECTIGKERTAKLRVHSRGGPSARVAWYALTWTYKGVLDESSTRPDRQVVLGALAIFTKRFAPGSEKKIEAIFLGSNFQRFETNGLLFKMFKPTRDEKTGVVRRSICAQEIGAGRFC